MKNIEKTLFVSPHTDDVELACGGTIVKFLEEGKEVKVITLSDGDNLYPNLKLAEEFRESMSALGIEHLYLGKFPIRNFPRHRQEILDFLVVVKKQFTPDTVFVPSRHDCHQDHQVVYQESIRAFRECSIFGYELPWNCKEFNPQLFVKLKRSHIEKKIASLDCYQSQKTRTYFNKDYTLSHARFRAIPIFSQYAEVFEVEKLIK